MNETAPASPTRTIKSPVIQSQRLRAMIPPLSAAPATSGMASPACGWRLSHERLPPTAPSPLRPPDRRDQCARPPTIHHNGEQSGPFVMLKDDADESDTLVMLGNDTNESD